MDAVGGKEQSNHKPERFQASERVVLMVLAAVQFTSIVDFMVVMPLGPQLMRSLKITPGQFGLIVSSYTFAAGAAGLIAAPLIDRFSRRTAFLTLFAGFLVGTFWCGFAPNYPTLVAARIATGMFGGILGGMAMAIIGDVFPEERRGRATGALMSAFALASVAGVPFGLHLGVQWGWHAPFLALVVLGCPVLVVAAVALPPLRSHLTAPKRHPLHMLAETFSHPNHLRAFALVVSLMMGGFAVIPYISAYLVANVRMPEAHLVYMYMVAGAVTLFTAPLIGRLADRYGKLRVYRVVAPFSALFLLSVTVLPPVPTAVAVSVVAALMVSNAGRMVAAMSMVTSSVLPARRGGFMSANSSVQHMASGIGSFLGGHLIGETADGRISNFETVGVIAALITLSSLWLAGRLRTAEADVEATPMASLAAAAEASCDVGEPLAGPESF